MCEFGIYMYMHNNTFINMYMYRSLYSVIFLLAFLLMDLFPSLVLQVISLQ